MLLIFKDLCIIVASVSQSVAEEPRLSIPRRAQQLGLSYGTLWRILHLDLHLHPYEVQLVQELKPRDHLMRRQFADWVIEQETADPVFSNKIFFSDEAHFWIICYRAHPLLEHINSYFRCSLLSLNCGNLSVEK